jgi:hypothetical protein
MKQKMIELDHAQFVRQEYILDKHLSLQLIGDKTYVCIDGTRVGTFEHCFPEIVGDLQIQTATPRKTFKRYCTLLKRFSDKLLSKLLYQKGVIERDE